MRIEIDGGPSLGLSPVIVYLNRDEVAIRGATVEVRGDMTHAGMSPVIERATEVEPGIYRAEEFSFTMAGDWFITTDIELPEGDTLTESLPVTVPR
ncbi:MAG: FixH family protein [Trueperaceae bacterium]|nr:MAG: FixH family protein [Trueperaceae bacterium]